MSTHNLLILIHALGGGLAFITGWIVLIPSLRQSTRATWLTLFLAALMVLIIALFAVVTFDWPQFVLIRQIIFGGLCLLALYMGWCAVQAYRVFRDHPAEWMAQFIDHIGFVLISLFDGLVIISALDLGAPGWMVGIIAVLGVAAGIWALKQMKTAVLKRSIS